MSPRSPADAAQRERAIRERTRNVIVDAGAGTGKTTLLIARLLHLIAPDDDGPAFALERLAAITFTRKAAGELKLRLRESLLALSARDDLSALRSQRLAAALEALDNAAISTVHSFADRLLRLRPADAQLSPAYEIAEDPSSLVEETYAWLLHAAQHGGLESCLPKGESAELAREATETLQIFQLAGLRVRTQEQEFYALLGLDAFVDDVIETRDRSFVLPSARNPDFDQVRRCSAELLALLPGVDAASGGGRWLHRFAERSERITQTDDLAEAMRCAVDWTRELRKVRKALTKGEHFADDPQGWAAWKWFCYGERGSGKRKETREGGALGVALVAPLMACMAERLVRLRPIAIARYAQVKREHGVVDQIDLLIELRDLLQRNLAARAFYQSCFDHLMVDEFQDTDPLQAEIVLFLCEASARATRMSEVELQPGKLTIVGDPKQSIYRFRRADIAMYAEVCAQLRKAPVTEAQLTVNFRSSASILAWLNEGFDAVLGAAADGPPYDASTGTVRNVRLAASGNEDKTPGVHVLPFGDASSNVDEARDLEGEALAHYLRHLVESAGVTIRDPQTRAPRPPRYGDIAVMMIATQTVHHLTTELDRIGVPHVIRGGTLFMQDALHQQFLLGLCALADPQDGVARAALLRPPFFALSLEELVRGRNPESKSAALQAAESLITELRSRRHLDSPGETARRVLERTGFGCYVAAGVNGAQRIARLYELCLSLAELARNAQVDFDGTMAIARGWIDGPPRIDAPLPIDADAVQVITTHQAKGLEWPIVALWDGRAGWRAFLPQRSWTLDAISGEWALELDGLVYDPSDKALQQRERELRAAERRRVAYVAATRARELLIIPEAGEPSDKSIAGTLLISATSQVQWRVPRYERDGAGWWRSATGVSSRPIAVAQPKLQEAWVAATTEAFAPYLVPIGVTSVAHARDHMGEPEEPSVLLGALPRTSRFGAMFGSTVHRALQLLLTKGISAEDATRRAASEYVLRDHIDEAIEDVQRAHAALRGAGLCEHMLRLEYPVAGSLQNNALLTGYIDLLVCSPGQLVIVDFKTDAPPQGEVDAVYPGYVAQVCAYRKLLESTAIAADRQVKVALLFTGDGQLRWVAPS